jgi:hypothetical protein
MQTVIERAEKPVVEKKVERTIKEQLEKVRENLGQGRDLKESIASLLELEVQIDAKINEKGAGKLAYNESCLLGVQCLCY